MTNRSDQERPAPARALQRFARHWVSIALAAISLVYGGAVTVLHDDSVSPIDEVVYLDYTYKLWDQGLVHKGETFGDEVAHLVACENVIPFGSLGQECGSDDVNLAAMPNAGYTTGEGYTPIYFWTVRIIGDPVHAITGLSEVTSWRLSGVVWLAGTILVLAALLRRAGVPQFAVFALGLLFIGSPYAWWTYTYISTDTSVVIFGASILLVTMEAVRGRWSAWWLVPLAVLAPLFKITNLVVFGLVLIYLVLDSLTRRIRKSADYPGAPRGVASVTRLWLPIGLAIVLAGAIQAAWLRIIPLLAVSDVVVDQGITTPLTAGEVVRLALSGITGAITHNPAVGRTDSMLPELIFVPLSWLAIAGVIGAVMSMQWNSRRGPLVWGTAVATIAALPALGCLMWFLTGVYFPLPGRYAAGLVPAILLVTGFMLRSRVATIGVVAYSALLLTFGVTLAIHIGASY